MYLWTPTKDFLRVSKELAYNIFFLILAESGHQLIRNNFCFLELSAVPYRDATIELKLLYQDSRKKWILLNKSESVLS